MRIELTKFWDDNIYTLDNDDSKQNQISRTDSAFLQIMQHVDCFDYSKIH